MRGSFFHAICKNACYNSLTTTDIPIQLILFILNLWKIRHMHKEEALTLIGHQLRLLKKVLLFSGYNDNKNGSWNSTRNLFNVDTYEFETTGREKMYRLIKVTNKIQNILSNCVVFTWLLVLISDSKLCHTTDNRSHNLFYRHFGSPRKMFKGCGKVHALLSWVFRIQKHTVCQFQTYMAIWKRLLWKWKNLCVI